MHRANPGIALMAIVDFKRRGKGLHPICCVKLVEKVCNSSLPVFHMELLYPVSVSEELIGRPQTMTVQLLTQEKRCLLYDRSLFSVMHSLLYELI